MSESTVTQELKSVLIAKQKELNAKVESLLTEIQKKEYIVEIGTKKLFNQLMKFLEKDAKWNNSTAAGLIMLYSNMKEQHQLIPHEWDGNIKLRSSSVIVFWSMLSKMEGSGFYEARSFVELMAACGKSLTDAVNKTNKETDVLRELHSELSVIDDKLASGNYEDDGADEDMSLKEHVDPIVNA